MEVADIEFKIDGGKQLDTLKFKDPGMGLVTVQKVDGFAIKEEHAPFDTSNNFDRSCPNQSDVKLIGVGREAINDFTSWKLYVSPMIDISSLYGILPLGRK
jgi:hypothetical protein